MYCLWNKKYVLQFCYTAFSGALCVFLTVKIKNFWKCVSQRSLPNWNRLLQTYLRLLAACLQFSKSVLPTWLFVCRIITFGLPPTSHFSRHLPILPLLIQQNLWRSLQNSNFSPYAEWYLFFHHLKDSTHRWMSRGFYYEVTGRSIKSGLQFYNNWFWQVG